MYNLNFPVPVVVYKCNKRNLLNEIQINLSLVNLLDNPSGKTENIIQTKSPHSQL